MSRGLGVLQHRLLRWLEAQPYGQALLLPGKGSVRGYRWNSFPGSKVSISKAWKSLAKRGLVNREPSSVPSPTPVRDEDDNLIDKWVNTVYHRVSITVLGRAVINEANKRLTP